jgi:hypothetical protein
VVEEIEGCRAHLKVEGLDLMAEPMKSATSQNGDR